MEDGSNLIEHLSLNGSFVRVSEQGANGAARLYYGGTQAWFSRKTQRDGGCAQVCAANILAYLFKNEPALNGICFSEDGSLPKEEYIRLLDAIYEALPSFELPFFHRAADREAWKGLSTLGVSSPYRFAKRVVKFAAKKGVFLTSRVLASPCTKESLLAFLKEGIRNGTPVALLNLFRPAPMLPADGENGGEQRFHNHWVTVTGISEDACGKVVLEVSSWGERYFINMDRLFQNSRWSLTLSAVLFLKK